MRLECVYGLTATAVRHSRTVVQKLQFDSYFSDTLHIIGTLEERKGF
jgi:hypothetical protein